MIVNCVLLWPNINLEKQYNFKAVLGDTIVWNIQIVGLDLTNMAIRGELYDLNTSNRMANALGGAESAPEIVVTDAVNGKFTATTFAGLTSTMQLYSQVEFSVTDATGAQTTIMQQAVTFSPARIIWQNEAEGVYNDTGEDPLF